MGHLSFAYLDDGFTSQPDFISTMAASTIQRKELRLSGLVTNEEKSNREPRQVGEWLGLVIDTIAMQYRVPDKKLSKLKSLLDGAVSDKYITIRQLARIAGSVISISLAVGPIALPRIKDLLLEGPGQAILYKRRQSVFVGCPAFRILALRLEFI